MGLFLTSLGYKTGTNLSFQDELKVLDKNLRLIVNFHGRVNTLSSHLDCKHKHYKSSGQYILFISIVLEFEAVLIV